MKNEHGLLFVLSFSLFAGCEPYSPETVMALEGRQTSLSALYATFGGEVDWKEVEAEQAALGTILEAQRARGKDNAIMTSQVADLKGLVDLHIEHRRKDGPWSAKAIEIHTSNLKRAFDLAIKTEKAKQK